MTAIFIAVGTIAGVILGWFLASLRAKSADGRVEEELRRQITDRDADLDTARSQISGLTAEAATANAAKDAAQQQLVEGRERLLEREGLVTNLRTSQEETRTALAACRADLEAAKYLLEERQAFHERETKEARAATEKAIADLKESFKALSAEALKQNAPEFLRLAEVTFGKLQETAKGDLEKRQEAIAGLLKPLETHLKTYQDRLQQTESDQTRALSEVKQQLTTLTQQSQSLANETERFRMVLKSNQARGKWGEETLRRVVEAAGMSAHCDFVEQTKEEDKKPDMVVRLPGDRIIIVDSKVPDLDFITALETADLEKRKKLLELHADKLKETIKDLAKRNYPAQFPNALDHVVLFLPAESLFSAALEGDRDLIIWAASNRIMLATPASLIALLRSVSVSWQQYDQSRNARDIAAAAQELFGRVAVLVGHFEKIRSGLTKANDAFNDAVGSYERSVRPSGERLLKLGVDAGGKVLADLTLTGGALRALPATVEEKPQPQAPSEATPEVS